MARYRPLMWRYKIARAADWQDPAGRLAEAMDLSGAALTPTPRLVDRGW
jgi:hypothetical protein